MNANRAVHTHGFALLTKFYSTHTVQYNTLKNPGTRSLALKEALGPGTGTVFFQQISGTCCGSSFFLGRKLPRTYLKNSVNYLETLLCVDLAGPGWSCRAPATKAG
jgi:hypothetical protein